MKINIITGLACILMAMASCKKSDAPKQKDLPDDNNGIPMVELLCQTWTLSETYIDDEQETQNGQGKFKFKLPGDFEYYNNSQWQKIADFEILNDSASLYVTFQGAPTYYWQIKKLTETELSTEFHISGKKYNYIYRR